MKITITKFESVEISDNQAREITKKTLRSLVAPGEYLRTEKKKIVVKQDDPHWRHGSISEDYVRDATELDIAVFKVLENLDK